MSAPTDNIDYSPTSNVARLHAAAAREKGDPAAKATPISLRIIGAIVVIGILAGSYRGANTGTDVSAANIKGYDYPLKFDGVSVTGGAGLTPLELHQSKNWIAAGKTKYGQCAACHTGTGEGQPGQFPPLKGSEFVIKGEKRVISILQHGINGSLTVNGKPFNGQMQPLGGAMPDKDLAQLLSYIRNEWGNSASVIYEDQVKAVRKDIGNRAPYSEAELRAIPEDANAPVSEWIEKLKAGAAPAAGKPPAAGTPAPAAGVAVPAAIPAAK